MTSIGKENRSSYAFLIKNSKGEGGCVCVCVGGGGGGGGRKTVGRTGRRCMVYKIGLK